MSKKEEIWTKKDGVLMLKSEAKRIEKKLKKVLAKNIKKSGNIDKKIDKQSNRFTEKK